MWRTRFEQRPLQGPACSWHSGTDTCATCSKHPRPNWHLLQAGRPSLLSSRPVPLCMLRANHAPQERTQGPHLPLRPRLLALRWQRSAAPARCSAAAGRAPGAEPDRGGEAEGTSPEVR